MSLNKKRKSDIYNEQTGVTNPKKEKWYDEEQKAKMLSAPLEPTPTTTSRRSSFMGAMGALKRMVSGSGMKDKSRNTSKLPAAQLPSGPATFKDEDRSFASETSQESDHIPTEKLVNNYGLRKFVQTGEAPEKLEMEVTSSDTSASTASVLSMVTPCRNFKRDNARRSSVRSMPETTSLVEGFVSSAVRRHASVSSSDHNAGSPSRFNSFKKFFKGGKHSSSIADSSENPSLNTSFAPLAEADESQDMNVMTPEGLPFLKSRGGTLERSVSKFFGSGNSKRVSIANASEIFNDTTNTAVCDFETPTNAASINKSPSSSGLQKKVSSALNMFRFKSTPSPGRRTRVERSRTENPKKDHRIRKRTEINPRRSSLAPGGLNMSLIETLNEQAKEKERAQADLFRNKVRLSEDPVPGVLKNNEFDAILVDLIDGRAASSAAQAVLNFYSAADEVKYACDADSDKKEIVYKKEGHPFLVCIKLDSHCMKPLDARVRTGVGSGLREVWKEKTIKRILAYPMFCFDEKDWNDIETCIQQFYNMVLNALEWNSAPENIEYVVLAGLSPAHVQLMKEQFQRYLSILPTSDVNMAEITETVI